MLTLLPGCGASTPKPPTSRAATASSAADDAYGTLPSYLPSSAVRADSVLTGTAANPALTSEGDAVDVRLGAATVRATVAGPLVPGEGLPYQTPATTCTWTVTVSAARGAVPLRARDFSVVDHLGAVYHLAFAPGRPQPPAFAQAGQAVTFQLRAVLPTGEGLMRWAPEAGRIVAKWDFVVEND